ncbi:hypothetical protein DFH06DRAFT_1130917 [Mycena polygramma]|nr:hypothetical protein DFH06DRAFT_1130917 [Mycena polygramma]
MPGGHQLERTAGPRRIPPISVVKTSDHHQPHQHRLAKTKKPAAPDGFQPRKKPLVFAGAKTGVIKHCQPKTLTKAHAKPPVLFNVPKPLVLVDKTLQKPAVLTSFRKPPVLGSIPPSFTFLHRAESPSSSLTLISRMFRKTTSTRSESSVFPLSSKRQFFSVLQRLKKEIGKMNDQVHRPLNYRSRTQYTRTFQVAIAEP